MFIYILDGARCVPECPPRYCVRSRTKVIRKTCSMNSECSDSWKQFVERALGGPRVELNFLAREATTIIMSELKI